MALINSYIHPYEGYHKSQGLSHVAIYEHAGTTIVICTEALDNPSTSITNMAEYIATDIWEACNFVPLEHFIWLERYQARGFIGGRPQFKEDFSRVTFTKTRYRFGDPMHQAQFPAVLREPAWKHLTKDEVERLIGEPYVAPDLGMEA